MGLKVASKLLNSASKSLRRTLLDVKYIKRDRISKNPKNRVSIDGIEELAQDIKMAGLEQPLVVYPKEDGYMLLTGERRLTAIDLLIENGNWDPEADYIPCIERPLDLYQLPLDEDLKERYAILRTNAFNRKFTDADLLVQAEDYQKIIKELKKQGYKELITGYDENGEPVRQDITGRTRNVVAGMVGVSTGQVSKIENILKNGSERVREAVADGKMSIAAASRLASYDRETQAKFLEENDVLDLTANEVSQKVEPPQLRENENRSEEIKRICKNCVSCKPGSHGGYCEVKNTKTKDSGTCDKWQDKNMAGSAIVDLKPVGENIVSGLSEPQNEGIPCDSPFQENPSLENPPCDEFRILVRRATELCDDLKSSVSEENAWDKAIALIDEELRPLIIRLQNDGYNVH